EEEEFERIVIDKSQKGNVEEAQRVAAEQIVLARAERERHIEATHERVEPLRDMEQEEAAEIEGEAVSEPADGGEAAKMSPRQKRQFPADRESGRKTLILLSSLLILRFNES